MTDNEQDFAQKACRVYRQCSTIPTPASARIYPSEGGARWEVEVLWSQRELSRGKKLVSAKSYFLRRDGGDLKKICETKFQADASRILKVSHGLDGTVKAVLVKDTPSSKGKPDKSTEPQQYIEIWREGALVKTIDVQSLKKHGKIHEDVHFGSFQLSPDSKKLLYIAEKEKGKPVSFFKKTPESKPEDGPAPRLGAQFEYEQSWGEQLDSVVSPIPVVLEWENEDCTVISTDSIGNISAAQAIWCPKTNGVVFVGVENDLRKLGFVFCLNRRSALYHADVKAGSCFQLTDNTHCVFSPRFNQQGDRMVYYEATAGGPHHVCAALKMTKWTEAGASDTATAADVVRKISADEFPGFYAASMPQRCWDAKGRRVVLTTSWRSLQEAVCVDVEGCGGDGGKVWRLRDAGDGSGKGAWSILDVCDDIVVVQYATPTSPPKLLVGVLPANAGEPISHWTEIASTSTTLTDGLSWEILELTPPEEGAMSYEAILLKPQPSSLPPPLLVHPHGGPHGVFPAGFLVMPVCMAALGFAVLMVNYRGSTGFGQDFVHSLPGKVGTQDVQDVHNAALAVVNTGGVDGRKVVVSGGSHGGFLTAHLVAQFPDFYKAGVAHNPVTNFALNFAAGDIPDWVCVECGVDFDPARPVSVEDIAKMLTMSPIHLAEKMCAVGKGYEIEIAYSVEIKKKIKAPLMFVLGTEDLRCPPSQGRELYLMLKARGCTTRLLLYPGENHPISDVTCDADSFVNSATWLHKHGCSDSQ